jgi:hypothetical protein
MLYKAKRLATTLMIDSRASEKIAVEPVQYAARNLTPSKATPIITEAEIARRRRINSLDSGEENISMLWGV